jgi:hypothetical protein
VRLDHHRRLVGHLLQVHLLNRTAIIATELAAPRDSCGPGATNLSGLLNPAPDVPHPHLLPHMHRMLFGCEVLVTAENPPRPCLASVAARCPPCGRGDSPRYKDRNQGRLRPEEQPETSEFLAGVEAPPQNCSPPWPASTAS